MMNSLKGTSSAVQKTRPNAMVDEGDEPDRSMEDLIVMEQLGHPKNHPTKEGAEVAKGAIASGEPSPKNAEFPLEPAMKALGFTWNRMQGGLSEVPHVAGSRACKEPMEHLLVDLLADRAERVKSLIDLATPNIDSNNLVEN